MLKVFGAAVFNKSFIDVWDSFYMPRFNAILSIVAGFPTIVRTDMQKLLGCINVKTGYSLQEWKALSGANWWAKDVPVAAKEICYARLAK